MSEENAVELETISQEHNLVMGESLERLRKNPDFKRVILEGYLEQKVLASVSILGVPQERAHRTEVMEDLISASNLQYFFRMVDHLYQGAKDPILSDEEEAELEGQE